MTKTLTCLLAWLLAFPAGAQTLSNSAKEQVLRIISDSAIEVRLLDNSKLRGRLGAISDTGFELRTELKGRIETKQISFDRVTSVRDLSSKHRASSAGRTIGKTLAITYVVVGAIGLICIIVAAATR